MCKNNICKQTIPYTIPAVSTTKNLWLYKLQLYKLRNNYSNNNKNPK